MISQIIAPAGSHGRLGRTIARDLGMRRNDQKDRSKEWQEFLLPAQKHTLGNCEKTVVQPIDWHHILAPTEPPNNPQKVRQYLAQIVQRMNKHFGIIMSGPDIGQDTSRKRLALWKKERYGASTTVACTAALPETCDMPLDRGW